MPYDTYTIEELRCDSNKGMTLIPAFDVVVSRNKTVIDLGTLTDEYEPEITIHTTAADKATGEKSIVAGKSVTIVDTVNLDGLKKVQMTAYRDFGRKQKREVSLEYLISETPLEPFTTDTYFEQYDQPTVFAVKGQEIVVASKRLADALLKLTEQRRNVLFLYFFFGYTDAQIGKEYGRNRSTANYWKLAALKQLRKEMERLEHEEQEADTL